MVCLFVVMVYILKTEFFVVVRIIAIEPITLLTDVGSCMANLSGIFERLICLILQDHLLDMTNTLGTFIDESVTLLKSEYDSLIQKIHSVSNSNIATLVYIIFNAVINLK